MNDFEPKFIKIASKYLDEKFTILTNVKKPKAYVVEKKKESIIRRLMHSFFNA
ncbi:hypothetical protein KJ870_01180 [bacterium]|jgi:hypothetical protein|nr:hypothetical protein [bacterium]MBU1433537.1 hypothetical protein [bacterium]